MPRPTTFTKYQGLGNDFLVFDRRDGSTPMGPELAARLCDRRLGVGGDGVLSILAPTVEDADLRMEIHNADGSVPETCGNGLRCLAAHALRRLPEFQGRRSIRVQTGAGTGEATLLRTEGASSSVRVEMGAARLDAAEVPTAPPLPQTGRVIDAELDLGDLRPRLTALSLGNPHAVVFVEDPKASLPVLGPRLVAHPAFPKGVNVGLARVVSSDLLELFVWERGVGPTRACGSGACAAAVAAILTGRIMTPSIRVRLPGGSLLVEVGKDPARIDLTGPAVQVFEGSLDLQGFVRPEGSVADNGHATENEGMKAI